MFLQTWRRWPLKTKVVLSPSPCMSVYPKMFNTFKLKKSENMFLNLLIVVSVWKLADRLATERRGTALGLVVRLLDGLLVICLVACWSIGLLVPSSLMQSMSPLLVTAVLIVAGGRGPSVPTWGLLFVSHGLPFTAPGLLGSITSMASVQSLPWIEENIKPEFSGRKIDQDTFRQTL